MSSLVSQQVDVDLGDRSYPIYIGRDLHTDLPSLLPFDISSRKAFILSDENISDTHAASLKKALENSGAGPVHMLVMPPGEQSKSWNSLQKVLSWLLDSGVDRASVLYAVGGGVIGDLGGFAAATILRGIGFVQVPTTLLAQVDSSVGGKTGINMTQGKNLVGAFYQPLCVLSDISTLKTLPAREVRAGYAEIVKYGLINDPEFFIWLESNGHRICDLVEGDVAEAVSIACRKKAEIVKEDEREGGVRALLNLGHTFGHALEAACGYDGSLLHGEAVAVGMALAFHLSVRLGHCPEKDMDRVIRHLKDVGLPTCISEIRLPTNTTASDLLAFMKKDKKVTGGSNVLILTRGIGKAYVDSTIPDSEIEQVLMNSIQRNAL